MVGLNLVNLAQLLIQLNYININYLIMAPSWARRRLATA